MTTTGTGHPAVATLSPAGRAPARSDDCGPPRQLVGRAAAALFLLSGVMSLVSLVRPDAQGEHPLVVLLIGLAAALTGLVCWYLPWQVWPRWSTLLLVPFGFSLIALRNVYGGDDPYLYSVFFVIVFTWIGAAHRPWTSVKVLPLFVAAYLLPLLASSDNAELVLSSVLYVGLACVLIAETLARISLRLRRSQEALQRARAAVNDIGGELSSARDPERLWEVTAAKLCDVLEVPDCDVYRLEADGDLECLASIAGGEPCREYLGRRVDLHTWGSDTEAVRTREPLLIASPDDPRLSETERAEMLEWGQHTALVVPLVARDEIIGLVEIGETRPGKTLSDEQVATATSVCRLLAMSIHDAEVIVEQGERARQIRSVLESSRAVASAASLEEALTIVTRCAGEVLEVSECVAYEYDADDDAIIARAMWEATPSGWDRLGEPLPLAGHDVTRAILASGRPLLECCSDPEVDAVSRAEMEAWGEQSVLSVPMASLDGSTGLLTLWSRDRDLVLDEDETALAVGLAEIAGEAVRGAQLVRRLTRLSETDSLTGLANHRKLRECLEREAARAERYGTCFSLLILDIDDFKLLNDTYGHPAGDEVLRQIATLLTEHTRSSDVVGRYGGDEFLLVLGETPPAAAGELAEKLRGALAATPYTTEAGGRIPIRASFGISGCPEHGLQANELIAAADANLYTSKRRGGDAVTGARQAPRPEAEAGGAFDLFESLVTAVDNKDRYTRRHSEEVTERALELGEALGLSDDSLRVLRVAGLLHDVGKIGVPDPILRKPGRLTSAEYDIVKGHATLGETIISALPDVEEVRAAVISHHERYDGAGYPRGLRGKEIPLLGRIMAVADAYSAMTADRPYRKALSREDAIGELRLGAGTQFDPEIVASFIACLTGRCRRHRADDEATVRPLP